MFPTFMNWLRKISQARPWPSRKSANHVRLSVEEMEKRVVPVAPSFSFGASAYSVTEPEGLVSIVVQRSSSEGAASVFISAVSLPEMFAVLAV
jgi:hypothetical protein